MQDITNIVKNFPRDWVLEIDLEYTKEIHELHNYYPLVRGKL